MELWYWHHSYLVSAEALAKSEALADRAAAAGYTGLALWDSSLTFLNEPDWPAERTAYLKAFIDYAHAKGLTVMPAILPYGHSDDVLKAHPDWAEGQRVTGVKFRRVRGELRLIATPPVALGEGRFLVETWHQYRVSFAENASGPVGAVDDENSHETRLDDVAHPGVSSFVFNSAGSTRIHVFGPAGFTLEQAEPTHVVRRAGAPLRIREDGGEVSMDYYAVTPVYGEGVGLCLTGPDVRRWAEGNARAVEALLPADSPLFLQYDEMRQMNSCERCRAMHMTAGELLAWHLRGTVASLPSRRLYVWSDMFDPWHNAHDHYYYVEGDLKGSWEGLPRAVTVMNWNGHRRASLEFFAARGNRQVIAGYYDPPGKDGWRAAREELAAANGIAGIAGAMYTTWQDDYSQLENYAQGARRQWAEYVAARPW